MADGFLDADQLRAATFVRHVELHDTLSSTNDRAAELVRDSTIELPALVVARRQTAGRGRGGNNWWSAEGALTFSVLLDSAAIGISAQSWPQLSLATAAAISDVLEIELQQAGASSTPVGAGDGPARSAREAQLGIKWPNDVMIDGRKVAGILIESPSGATHTRNRLIIGIGINVNNTWRAAPPSAGSAGTALTDATQQQHDLQRVLTLVLQAMQERLVQLGRNDPSLPKAWQDLCVLAGRTVHVTCGPRHIEGTCTGVNDDGALVINTVSGPQVTHSGTARAVS